MTPDPRFPDWPHNRAVFPDRHVVVCEDDVAQQARIAERLARVCGGQGRVQASFVPGALMASAVIAARGADLVLLDHDMPNGNGVSLLEWMAQSGHERVPVLTFSGLDGNNARMLEAAARLGLRYVRKFSKNEVCDGAADPVIRDILGV